MRHTNHHHVFPTNQNLYLSTTHPNCQKNSWNVYNRSQDELSTIKTLNTLATQQSAPTENTNQDVKKFLDYCATYPDAKIIFFASEMILQAHSDASHMNETKACSTASGKYFLRNNINSRKPIVLNGVIHTLCKIIGVAASAAAAELGILFLNRQETVKLRMILQELGLIQPPTPIHADNNASTGIIHRTIKQQRSCAMNMRYFWTISKQDDKNIDVSWHPGRGNLADYYFKHHSPNIHQNLQPTYLHMPNSPRYLQHSVTPHLLLGCAKTSPCSVLRTHV